MNIKPGEHITIKCEEDATMIKVSRNVGGRITTGKQSVVAGQDVNLALDNVMGRVRRG